MSLEYNIRSWELYNIRYKNILYSLIQFRYEYNFAWVNSVWLEIKRRETIRHFQSICKNHPQFSVRTEWFNLEISSESVGNIRLVYRDQAIYYVENMIAYRDVKFYWKICSLFGHPEPNNCTYIPIQCKNWISLQYAESTSS